MAFGDQDLDWQFEIKERGAESHFRYNLAPAPPPNRALTQSGSRSADIPYLVNQRSISRDGRNYITVEVSRTCHFMAKLV